jgi:signal transduction histidine kinase
MRAHPFGTDAAFAAALLILSFVTAAAVWNDPVDAGIRRPDLGALVLLAVATAPVAFRRRAPVPALVVMTLALLASQGLAYEDHGGGVGVLVGAYAVAAHAQPKVSWRWAVGYGAVLSGWIVLGIAVNAANAEVGAIVATNIVYGTAWILGDNVRRRRERVSDLEERARRLEHERELETREVRSRERAAIARELHDVVAHSMTVMVVQASGARRTLARDPDAAAEALRVIEDTGRSSLVEMRRILGVLRDDATPDLAPQPSVARIAELASLDPDRPVAVVHQGDARELTPSVDVSAYRIVQEALTNVRKHAGPHARATVSIDYGPDALTVRVDDDGRGAITLAAPPEHGSGNGLVGMRERVAVCGGTLRTGPRSGGGWSVVATLPYESALR